MLQKALQFHEQLSIGSNNSRNDLISLLIYHNLSLCYQKLGLLMECGNCLKKCLRLYKKLILPCDSLSVRFKHLKYLSKAHMQYCAILSQQNKHLEALDHAKYGIKYSHEIINLTAKIAENFQNEIPQKTDPDSVSGKKSQNNSFFGDCSALLNRPFNENNADFICQLSKKILPVLTELISRFVPESIDQKNAVRSKQIEMLKDGKRNSRIDARNLFGYMQCSEWVTGLNIGNIMQVSPLTLQDVIANYDVEIEISRETLLEKIALLAVSYFCVSTEKRFLAQEKAQPNNIGKQSEFWHAKALEIACCFLPGECPLVNHIFSSYQKHHSHLAQPIVFLILLE